MRIIVVLLCGLVIGLPGSVFASNFLSQRDAGNGLRQALIQGAQTAVAQLGKEDGFLGDPQVKIPLPERLQQVEKWGRMLGMSRYADELVVAMNRAAEAAVPEAKDLLVQSIRTMSVADAKGILSGGDDSATQYFRRVTSDRLMQRFRPIVVKATEKVRLAKIYNEFAAKGMQYGLVDQKDARIEDYVTQKALDGLFLIIAEKERAIRADPVGQASGIVRKVFEALQR